jgi:hypothetical protein
MLQVCTLREQEVVLFDLEVAATRSSRPALDMTEGHLWVVR